jgi:plasmid maintenance system antidote protein VapI
MSALDDMLATVVGLSLGKAAEQLKMTRQMVKDMVAKSARFRLAPPGKRGAQLIKRRYMTVSVDDLVDLLLKEGTLSMRAAGRKLGVTPRTIRRLIDADQERVVDVQGGRPGVPSSLSLGDRDKAYPKTGQKGVRDSRGSMTDSQNRTKRAADDDFDDDDGWEQA